MHESYCKIYHASRDAIVTVLHLPGHHVVLTAGLAVLIDVTEQPIERPKRHQRAYDSGKKTRHTINAQLIVCFLSLQILTVTCGKGHPHDFTVFKQSRMMLSPSAEKYADAGYQGLETLAANSFTPIKKPNTRTLTTDEQRYNRLLARLRIQIEHVNR